MHILRPHFRMSDEAALAFAAERGFGLLVSADGAGPRGSHVPFVLRREGENVVAQVHLTAKNPLVALADGDRRFLLAVSGSDSYVSNDWYVSSDQVSTWLYEAVHLSGIGSLRPLDTNRGHGDHLLAETEARLQKDPWSLAGMEPGKREAMLTIRVIDIAVDRIEGQSKLNQHKIDADHVAVADHLARSGTTAGRDLAGRMRALRPHLRYSASENMP
jgi:transcriptional regulator